MSCSEAAAERMSSSGDPYMSRANDVVRYAFIGNEIDIEIQAWLHKCLEFEDRNDGV